MEKEPKYKLGQKVWFVAENDNLCYGTIILITPINYYINYNIKMTLNSVGDVIKNNINEGDVIGDFDIGRSEAVLRACSLGIAKEIDKRIIQSMIADGTIPQGSVKEKTFRDEAKEVMEEYEHKFNTYGMGTVEPLYDFGLERDFSCKDDLAFIMGAIKKYGSTEGCYADLTAYLMNMLFALIRDMRKEKCDNSHIDKENKPDFGDSNKSTVSVNNESFIEKGE